MKKLLLLLLLFTGLTNAQIVNIPDANFKAKLLSSNSSIPIALDVNGVKIKIDTNGNNEIELSEAKNVSELYIHFSLISSLEGIQFFSNLRILGIKGNSITSLDLSSLSNLEGLNATDNSINTMYLNGLDNLKYLECHNNQLTNIDTSSLTQLESLACVGNQITDLDLSQNLNLSTLYCRENLLTSLDVSLNGNLHTLECDLNQLTSLFIKNGSYESRLSFLENPNLKFICADEEQLLSVQAKAGANVVVNSYCSFIPGGDFNTISGVLRLDEDSNGCDETDLPLRNIKININDGTIQGSTYTYNDQGSYAFNTGKVGTYTIEPVIENKDWFTVSPSNSIVTFSDIDNSISTQNFCVTPNGVHNDTEIIISPITPARPGFDAEYKIVYKNKGNQTLSGTVDFAFDDEVLDYVSASVSPDSQSIGNLSWNYADLLPFESRSFYMTLNVNSPMETPAVNIDDILKCTVTVNPVSGDETPADNIFEFNQQVVGSFDPNDIICLEGDIAEPSMIGEYLHYVVNFENTGTAAATFVVVKDVVDITKYDINSLQILSTSHNMETKIIGSKVEFVFYSINLGANKKGHVVFKIKSLNTLVTGNDVTKKADIYFDYNFPIETNLATTTFQNTLSSQVFKIDGSVSVSPNPTKDILNVRTNSFIKSIQIYDVQGRIVVTKLLNEKNSLIDISNFSNGIYFLKIKTEVGGKIEKVIKD